MPTSHKLSVASRAKQGTEGSCFVVARDACRTAAGLFGVEDDVEEQLADGGEDDVVTEERLDPEGGAAVAGEDGGRSRRRNADFPSTSL